MDQKQNATKNPEPSVKETKASPAEPPKSFDTLVDNFLSSSLAPFHGLLSEKAMETPDPQLDLASDKIAAAMTVLTTRSRERKKKGIYGQ